jgi:hypothetical protein
VIPGYSGVPKYYPNYCNFHHFQQFAFEQIVVVNRMAGKPNAKYFKCETCDYSTTQRGNLNQHTNQVHLKVKTTNALSVPTKG